MTFEQAQQQWNDYKYLLGTKYKHKEISYILIMEKDADLLAIGKAAQQVFQHGEHWPNRLHKEYELFVLYDLEDWLLSLPLQYGSLDALLKRLYP